MFFSSKSTTWLRVSQACAGFYLAAGLEGWHSLLIANYSNSLISDVERNLYWAKTITLGGQFIIFSAQLLNIFSGAALGAIFAPWMIAGILVIGLMYLGISLLLNKYQQTGLEKWLRQSPWGVQSKGWNEQQELFELEQEIYKPTGQVSQNRQLELILPRYLHTQAIGLDVTLTFNDMGPGPQRVVTCNIHEGNVTDEGNYLRYRLALTGIYSQMFNTLVRISFPANQGQQQHAFSLSGRGFNPLKTKEAEHSSINSTFTLNTETA